MKNLSEIIVLNLIMVLSISGFAQTSEPDDDAKYATELLPAGTAVPDFKLQTPEGKILKLSKFAKGKYVVIDFWASWCPDCRKDAPKMVELYNKFREKGVEFIGVSFDTDKEKWIAGIKALGLPYEQVSELVKMSQSPTASAYGVKWIPSIYLIDPDGKVVVSTVLSYKIENKLIEIFESGR